MAQAAIRLARLGVCFVIENSAVPQPKIIRMSFFVCNSKVIYTQAMNLLRIWFPQRPDIFVSCTELSRAGATKATVSVEALFFHLELLT